jgi:hypothetical protein
MWEMTDTKHWIDVVAGTPEQLTAIRGRLGSGRAMAK